MNDYDETVDVIVAGSGGGITGAYTAAREGLSVVLLEAGDKFGGTTAYSGGGGMWFPCNAVLRRAGSDDTIEAALTYFHAVVGDRTPRELQDTYVRGGADLIDYLEADDNFAFSVLPWPDYYGAAPQARLDGMRHIVATPVSAAALGLDADLIRGPLDNERFGTPAPDQLTGGRALIGRFLTALRRFPDVALHRNAELVDLIVAGGAVVGAVAGAAVKQSVSAPAEACCSRPAVSSVIRRCGPCSGYRVVSRTAWALRITPAPRTRRQCGPARPPI